MTADKVATLVPKKTDTESARSLRAQIEFAAQPYLEALNAAKAQGFEVQAAIGPRQDGKVILQVLRIFREF